ILGLGKSSMRVMPWEGSGRYSPGPGMVKLLEKWFYQELRLLMAICSLNPPGNLAIVSEFPTATVQWIHNHGATPYIRLMFRSSTMQNVQEPIFKLKDIDAGEFDEDLVDWGKTAGSLGYPLIAEWGTEMNGDWFSWNAKHNGLAAGAELFNGVYQRIVRKTRDAGAKNVTWVFHVNHRNGPDEPWNKLESYDPGPEFTDWIGVSLYGAQRPDEATWPVFSERMATVYPCLADLEGNRPIMVCEFGFTDGNPKGKPGPWAKDALDSLLSDRWPRIKGFSWWNEGWPDDQHGRTEMRLQRVKELADVFRTKLVKNDKVVDQPIVG